jgi:hypothetical protein
MLLHFFNIDINDLLIKFYSFALEQIHPHFQNCFHIVLLVRFG